MSDVRPTTPPPETDPRIIAMNRRAVLEKRLNEAGISPQDLADLLWPWLEDYLEPRVQTLAEEMVKRIMRTLNFSWRLDDFPINGTR